MYIARSDKVTAQKASWNNAVVQEVIAQYGSQLDTLKFLIGICDKCLANSVTQEQSILIGSIAPRDMAPEPLKGYLIDKKLHEFIKTI